MTTQVIYDMPAEDYHALPHLSKSGLDLIHKSPRHYWVDKFSNDPELKREETKALRVGAAFHTLVLEPQRFEIDVAVVPDCDKRTKEGKAIYAKFCAENEGKTIISEAEYRDMKYMRDAIQASPACRSILGEVTASEITLLGELEGVPFRSRLDGLIKGSNIVVDLKSTRNASADKFDKSIIDYRYYVQAAIYIEMTEKVFGHCGGFLLIPVDNALPFVPGQPVLLTKDSDWCALGKMEYQRDIATYKEANESGDWKGYDDDRSVRTNPNVPYWLLKQHGLTI